MSPNSTTKMQSLFAPQSGLNHDFFRWIPASQRKIMQTVKSISIAPYITSRRPWTTAVSCSRRSSHTQWPKQPPKSQCSQHHTITPGIALRCGVSITDQRTACHSMLSLLTHRRSHLPVRRLLMATCTRSIPVAHLYSRPLQ